VSVLSGMLDELEWFLRRYVVVTDAQATAITLWVVHAHALEATDTTPYLHVTSAESECGKSRLLEVLELVVPKPLPTAGSVTVAVMYRAIDALSPTLLLDEADNIFADRRQKAELLGVINSGFRRGQQVLRISGPQRDRLDSFSPFCAKAIAGLDTKLAPTLASRCLRIEMHRRRSDERIEPFYVAEARACSEPIRNDLAAWSESAVDRLRAARPERLGVRDRLEEGLRLLLAIAAAAGNEWDAKARAALLELADASGAGSETHRVQLLRDIHAVFEGCVELTTAELLSSLFAIEESPWADWWADARPGEAPHPTLGAARKLAALLRPFGVRSRDVGERGSRVKGYRLGDFADAFARYLPELSVPSTHIAQPSEKPVGPNRAQLDSVRSYEGGANPHEQRLCADGADRGEWDEEDRLAEHDSDELQADLDRMRADLRRHEAAERGREVE
jgi:Protein of unknown function (DUF3631)